LNQLARVVVAGHICLDIIPDLNGVAPASFTDTFQPGRLLEVGAATLSTGGPVSNTGLALHRLGIPVRLVGKVGADPFGRVVLDLVEAHQSGLSQGMIIDPGTSTSYSVIISPPGFDRLFLHNPGANHTFQASDVTLDLSQVDLFHFGYPPIMRQMFLNGGRELVNLFAKVKAAGATTSLDMAYPDPASEGGKADWRGILRDLLPTVDLFLPSIEELLYMLRRKQHDALQRSGQIIAQVTPRLLHELSDEMLDMGLRVAVIKLGERGLYLRTAGKDALVQIGRAAPARVEEWVSQELWTPCFQARVVGTTGSGDATIAGFLAAWLHGFSPQPALTSAVAVGACNVEAADALSGLRSWEETQARIANGWAHLPLQLEDPGWFWNQEGQIWQRSVIELTKPMQPRQP
jgi:sugar/nucleoside kinase (ribokinase family)